MLWGVREREVSKGTHGWSVIPGVGIKMLYTESEKSPGLQVWGNETVHDVVLAISTLRYLPDVQTKTPGSCYC